MADPTITYDLGYGHRYQYDVVAARDIETKARPTPGVYGWFIRVRVRDYTAEDCRRVSMVHAQKRLDVQVKGTLAERYSGEITRLQSPRTLEPECHKLASQVLTVFAPPLYLGISESIRRRLIQHRAALEAVFAAHGDPNLASFAPETDEESRSFGKRLGTLLWAEGVETIDQLMVKIVYCDDGEAAVLKSVEYVANRAFVPPFGIR